MTYVIRDRDGWWRVARNGRVIRASKAPWNLYRTKAGALSKARVLLAKVGD